jgi:hypothetical protein
MGNPELFCTAAKTEAVPEEQRLVLTVAVRARS